MTTETIEKSKPLGLGLIKECRTCKQPLVEDSQDTYMIFLKCPKCNRLLDYRYRKVMK